MVKEKSARFDKATDILSSRIRTIIRQLSKEEKENTWEVRIRIGLPIMLIGSYGKRFLCTNSKMSYLNTENAVVVSSEEMKDTFNRLCGYSLHSHQSEIREGYVTIDGGHRAGFCGSAVIEKKDIVTVKDISSINLRIAGQHFGAADDIVEKLYKDRLKSVIIAGAPLSGKTTVLRDLARQLSDNMNTYNSVCVVDERGELAAVSKGIRENDLGLCCDVLSGYPKGEGIITAIRSMSPDIIICDEIGKTEEIDAIESGLNSGVKFVISVHAESVNAILQKPQAIRLIKTGEFENIVFLKGKNAPGKIREIIETGELKNEVFWNCTSCNVKYSGRPCVQYEEY